MAEQLIILDPTEEVFGKCLEGILKRADHGHVKRLFSWRLYGENSQESQAFVEKPRPRR